MTANLPAPRDDRTPAPANVVPIRRNVIPMPWRQARRNIPAALAMHTALINAVGRFFSEVQEIIPDPEFCSALGCGADTVFWTDEQKEAHWRSHGAGARAWGHVRSWMR